MLLTIKSSKSRTFEPAPNGVKPLNTLKPRIHGSDKIIITNRLITTAFFRLQPVRSMANEIIFSKTAMIVEAAANSIKMKNSVPQKRPPDIVLNTFGSVIKSSDGPLPASILNAKHAGKIIRPAIKATEVSRTVT